MSAATPRTMPVHVPPKDRSQDRLLQADVPQAGLSGSDTEGAKPREHVSSTDSQGYIDYLNFRTAPSA